MHPRRAIRDAWTIAAKDARETWRDGRFRRAAGLLAAILAVGSLTGWAQATTTARLHAEAQAAERRLSLDKGEMNPHAAAHYGAFVFKPVEPLSAVDPGLTPYLGVTVFLEAHQQDFARHRPVADSTPARRLGELSVAGGLQVLVPLLIVSLAFGAFAGERERGTLRQLASLGVDRWTLALGKMAGCTLPVAAVLLPATLVGAAVLVVSGRTWDADAHARLYAMAAVYAAYFLLWIAFALAVSARSRTANGALVALLAAWFGCCFVAPPLASSLATLSHPSPTAAEFAVAIQQARSRLPRWPDRVAQVEQRFLSGDLATGPGMPSNPEVIALVDAERDESALYDTLFDELSRDYDRQARTYERFGWVLPSLSVQMLSMGLAATDYDLHSRFVETTSAYRRQFLQALNTELAAYAAINTFDYTRGRELWERLPEFSFAPPDVSWSLSHHREALAGLASWLALALVSLAWSVGRMSVA